MSTLTASTVETNSLQAESGTGEIALPTGHKIVAADAGALEVPPSPGQIIEVLTGVCDGSSVTVKSGTYALPSVTGGQTLTTTYADVTGSSIDYTPPTGTARVCYEFSHQLSWAEDHAISHWKLYIDGTEVTDARHSLSGRYPERVEHHMWVFSIGSANTATGAQSTWTSAKTIKLQARHYGTSNGNEKVHYTTYWDGTSGNQYSKPVIKITAIA